MLRSSLNKRWLKESNRSSSLWDAWGGPWMICTAEWAVIHSHLLSSQQWQLHIDPWMDWWTDRWRTQYLRPCCVADAYCIPSVKGKKNTCFLICALVKSEYEWMAWWEVTPPTPGDSQQWKPHVNRNCSEKQRGVKLMSLDLCLCGSLWDGHHSCARFRTQMCPLKWLLRWETSVRMGYRVEKEPWSNPAASLMSSTPVLTS